MRQAAQYETQGGAWDTVMKVLNTVFRRAPVQHGPCRRAPALDRGGAYDKVLAGEYAKRSDPSSKRDLNEDFSDAAGYYGEQARAAVSKLGDVFDRAKGAFDDAFKGGRR